MAAQESLENGERMHPEGALNKMLNIFADNKKGYLQYGDLTLNAHHPTTIKLYYKFSWPDLVLLRIFPLNQSSRSFRHKKSIKYKTIQPKPRPAKHAKLKRLLFIPTTLSIKPAAVF